MGKNKTPVHIIFSGLPGVGKTTIARELARRLGAVYLRIDSLEGALVASGVVRLEDLAGGGYQAAAAIAVDNLRNRLSVVTDSVNPWPLTRALWREASERGQAFSLGVEVVCLDREEHRRRVEERVPDLPGQTLPSWQDVSRRDYIPWADADIRINSAALSQGAAVECITERLGGR